MFNAILSGYLLGLSLIIAIGAQNAFVLRQGLRGQHVLPVVLTCALSDAVLIAAGVAGLGWLVERWPGLLPVLRYAGAAFLFAYALRALWSALTAKAGLNPAAGKGVGRAATLATCLALTWLNPHVYLDTVVLIGSVASRFGEMKAWFGLGAVVASFSFFIALGFGARLLRPLFARPAAWRVLDGVIALVMGGLAVKLLA
ncbi:LysE/ArgO family amino acid transporter [Niveispirillum cyanobacteriorum]|uniref:Amino acid transporter n=1 Tax=Niveispirillum cyanobacteriorum TaxID=1612173 RepID=A0A2K9NBG5_9PROT|nr:LysE/ArgO family amino acid transporter [Niveispirillum cyanobacteriorum]AUN30493.1 amino acid transporter [Niveispirillum cyanobacteriorum]GGE54059.1 amino acid transporter [Niveispirillum cyanobacteriorum]